MSNAPSTILFLDSVQHSFLPAKEKRRLSVAAKDGVTPELWNEFNDRLIAAIVQTKESQKAFNSRLDDEINRYTAHYERQKSVLDRELYDALKQVPESDSATRERLWHEYGTKIRALQAKLLDEVRRTSHTVLHDVVLAVVPVEGEDA